MKPIQFNAQKSKEFYSELKQKVNNYFNSIDKSDKGDRRLYMKTIILLLLRLGAYALIVFVTRSFWAVIGGYILFGIIGGLIGFNVMHDGGHGGYSHNKVVNSIMGYAMNLLGSNIVFWKIQHNLLHHTYTNIDQYDDDIDSWPIFRFHPDQDKKPFHKYQHFYFLPLYGIGILSKMFYSDFKIYFTRKIGNMTIKSFTLSQHIIFWITKIVMVFVYLIIPALMIGRRYALVGMVIMFFFMGIFLNTVFQLAHVLEKTEMKSHIDYKVDAHRAIHEIETTANFAMKSKIWTWLLGGLNFQIEHHLFPNISHVHYPKISRIVQEVCEKYDITYNYYDSVTKAFISHFNYIKKMGTL